MLGERLLSLAKKNINVNGFTSGGASVASFASFAFLISSSFLAISATPLFGKVTCVSGRTNESRGQTRTSFGQVTLEMLLNSGSFQNSVQKFLECLSVKNAPA